MLDEEKSGLLTEGIYRSKVIVDAMVVKDIIDVVVIGEMDVPFVKQIKVNIIHLNEHVTTDPLVETQEITNVWLYEMVDIITLQMIPIIAISQVLPGLVPVKAAAVDNVYEVVQPFPSSMGLAIITYPV